MFCDSLEIIEIEVDVTTTTFVKIKMSKKFRALKYKDYNKKIIRKIKVVE